MIKHYSFYLPSIEIVLFFDGMKFTLMLSKLGDKFCVEVRLFRSLNSFALSIEILKLPLFWQRAPL